MYYSPNNSIYHEVEQSGKISKHDNDTKASSTRIKIGAKITIVGLVKAAIDYTNERINSKNSSDNNYGASSATGDYGASSATGYKGASEAKAPCSIAVAWGYKGKAKGVIGSFLVLADWKGNEIYYNKENEWELQGAKMVRVDGDKIKPDTWYTMVNEDVVELKE